jgi:hypothetical protein
MLLGLPLEPWSNRVVRFEAVGVWTLADAAGWVTFGVMVV